MKILWASNPPTTGTGLRGKRGPYNLKQPRTSIEARAAQLARPPLCGCGCGAEVAFDNSRARWRRYVSVEHFRADQKQGKPYQQAEWLREQYIDLGKSSIQIASECGISSQFVQDLLAKFGIPRRGKGSPGAKNGAWKGGIAKWSYAPDWKAIARRVREDAHYTCQRCGECRKRWGRALHVHHIDKNKFNNDHDNLIALCAPCHRKVEYAE